MKIIAHVSDLHFGRELPAVAAGLIADLQAVKPALVVVSGDFTQRARRAEFAAARDYLAQLPHPQLAVPGNHDVPLFDVARRFLAPLTRYCEFIHPDTDPTYGDADMLVIGLNTARSFTWKNGRLSVEQIRALAERLREGGNRIKIVVTHHPFLPPPGDDTGIALVGRAAHAVDVLGAGEVDLLLAGHLHHGYAGDIRTHYPSARRAIVALQAGTAISCRHRAGELNAYNVITIAGEQLTIEVREWNGIGFLPIRRTVYDRDTHGWHSRTGKDPGTLK